MGLFDFFRGPDIHEGLNQYRDTKGAYLIDVREPQEYSSGHIPGSKNVPLSKLQKITKVAKSKKAPLFVYCMSGGRSARATAEFSRMGYDAVTNIGGIGRYRGRLER